LPDPAGTHDDVPIIEWSNSLSAAQIHTPSCILLAEDTVFRVCRHLSTLATRYTRIGLLSTDAGNPQTGGCPWLLTSNLYHLPFASMTHQGLQRAQVVQHLTSLGRPFGLFICAPVEDTA
jgi:hypothetical protein